jgi:predicted kinase
MKELILLRGLPGAGKSTLATLLGGKYVEADMYFIDEVTGEYKFNQRDLPKAHNWCKWNVSDWMENEHELIVVANTFTQEWEFKEYHELAKQHGYRVHSLIVENRHGNKSVHNVPDATMGNMLNRFEIKL